jgi:leader peptidase (prepilin peptidase)/N-methyltransferase
LLTALSFYVLFAHVESSYWFAYTIFFSALIVTIRTDLEHMLISRYMSLYLVPVALVCSSAQLLPITLTESILGTLFGYGLLWIIRRIFYAVRKIEGLGIGDAELLAMIGSFCGPLGIWISLLFGSLLGTLFALVYLIIKREGNLRSVKIPFGPFLAFGAMIFVIFEYELHNFFLP